MFFFEPRPCANSPLRFETRSERRVLGNSSPGPVADLLGPRNSSNLAGAPGMTRLGMNLGSLRGQPFQWPLVVASVWGLSSNWGKKVVPMCSSTPSAGNAACCVDRPSDSCAKMPPPGQGA